MRIDEVFTKLMKGEELLTEPEADGISLYVACLEIGYAGLQRSDMVDQARSGASKRIKALEELENRVTPSSGSVFADLDVPEPDGIIQVSQEVKERTAVEVLENPPKFPPIVKGKK